jgi:hypothetical protein
MRKALHYILLSVMSLLAFAGCDVHEFPEESTEKIPFLLHLDFNTEMPIYKEIFYARNGDVETRGEAERHNLRYIIKAYRTDNTRAGSRVADATFVFTKADFTDLNYTATIQLPEGTYDIRVWADYVDDGSVDDKYYDTRDFSEIIIADRMHHSGSNDYREAYRGIASVTVTNPALYVGDIVNTIDNQATVEMKRPMGKFKFVSTDVDMFIGRVIQMMLARGNPVAVDPELDTKAAYEKLLDDINLVEFYVVFRYNAFMPCSFNMFTDKPADSWTGMTFTSRMTSDDISEMTLGYDYIFVNGNETTLSISIEVYNGDGERMSVSRPINVPIVRSKMTVVKGEFLTSKATGGVTINPSYDGDDYNIEIY